MLHNQLFDPKTIAVIGGSSNTSKPGGKIVENLISGGFKNLHIVNPKSDEIQGIKCAKNVADLPNIDLGILAIPAQFCYSVVEEMADKKGTKAFIIISAGFGELNEEGKKIDKALIALAEEKDLNIFGPNCIGIINQNYKGVFTTPVPDYNPKGVDLLSSSGSTAVFIMEAGMKMGMQFSNIYSVGNAVQIQLEDILEHIDNNFVKGKNSDVLMIYLEQLSDPNKLLRHSRSLIKKGCSIVAIKAGLTEAGGRAASSHTGAMATPEIVIKALFKKAGIIMCNSREEMLYAAGILYYGKPQSPNTAIVTHAGGAGVMCADALESGGMKVPTIDKEKGEELLEHLYVGSSVANPIDFLATGTAEQLGIIFDYCNDSFDNVDQIISIFGSPGLFDVIPVYKILAEKIKTSRKPIYPVLPSPVNTEEAIHYFVKNQNIFFPDEVVLANNIAKVYHQTANAIDYDEYNEIPKSEEIDAIIEKNNGKYLSPEDVTKFLAHMNIEQVKEYVVDSKSELDKTLQDISYPVVMKVIGPVHKTDVGGVVLNIKNDDDARSTFDKIMKIKNAKAVLIQPMIKGLEIYVGAKREDEIGHIVMTGMGGIYLETLKDVNYSMLPIGYQEAKLMLKNLKSYKILKGYRGEKGIDLDKYAEILVNLSAFLKKYPQISEMDVNPLIATDKDIVAVDCRIKIDY